MASLSEVTTGQFREALTDSAVRMSQVIYLALAAGVSMFGLIVVLLYLRFDAASGSTTDYSLMHILSIAHVFLVVAAWTIGRLLFERQFSQENMRSAVDRLWLDRDGNPLQRTPAQKCLSVIRTASLMRLAALEGAAFFGLAVSLIAALGGTLREQPIYFLNMFSCVLFLGYVAATFPSAERLEAIFESRFHRL